MAIELNGKTQSLSADVPPSPSLGRRSKSRPLSGAVIARPMSDEAEVRFQAALQRIVRAMVANHLRGQGEEK